MASPTTPAVDDEALEITILQIKQCYICRVPPLASSEGHRAENWDRTAIWDGRCRIVIKGTQLIVLLEHTKGKEAGQLFAACPVHNDPKRPPAVDYVLDSSRYFVLRLDDGRGRHAYMGLSFASREDAFEFKSALQHQQNQERDEQKARAFMESTPARDFSIPSGEKLSLKLKVPTGKSSAKQGDDAQDDDGGFASSASDASAAASKPIKLVALAPPLAAPKATKKRAPDAAAALAPALAAASLSSSSASASSSSSTSSSADALAASFPPASDDDFGEWTDFTTPSAAPASAPAPSQSQPAASGTTASNAADSEWVGF